MVSTMLGTGEYNEQGDDGPTFMKPTVVEQIKVMRTWKQGNIPCYGSI